MTRRTAPLALLLLFLGGCSGGSPATADAARPDLAPTDLVGVEARIDAARPDLAPPRPAALYLQLDPALPAWLGPRLRELLGAATTLSIVEVPVNDPLKDLASGSLVIAVGSTATGTSLVPSGDTEFSGLADDGYLVRSSVEAGVTRLVALGREGTVLGRKANRGVLYAAYALLEELGFAFLHPLAPVRPSELKLPAQALRIAASPYWPTRGIHLHTMHPLELTDLLNGWGETGRADQAGFDKGLKEWRSVCEWLIANRQNMVEWVLLWAQSWATFAESSTRQQRLTKLVEVAHEYGLATGVDVSLALAQQHSFRLVQKTGTLAEEIAQIRSRVDYLIGAGFDFISTESGTSEFTAGSDTRMLEWMNELASYLKSKGKRAHIKVHCSQGVTASSYKDPKTGAPLNYNFLPHFAVPELGIMPHTVQHYALDDPAPTYANTSFSFMRDFLRMEGGRRDILWHPESSYWVSFDVDVPLFLPLYAERRLHDLRLIAADEVAGLVGEGTRGGSRIQGQVLFSSGWEWGYWLNDVVALRAAFAPGPPTATAAQAFRAALVPALRPFGSAAAKLEDLIVQIASDQRNQLILGLVNGVAPTTVVERNGQAYLQGWESYDDLGSLLEGVPGMPKMQTQPDKLGLVSMRNPLNPGPSYTKEIAPLLAAISKSAAAHLTELETLGPQIPPVTAALFEELRDSVRMTSLRAKQVHALYDYVASLDLLGNPTAAGKARLVEAQTALDQAKAVVAKRELAYRVPADRIASWRSGPTAYRFGYLWTVRRLHYWWRDEGKAVKAPASPCYLNMMDAAEIAFGEGFWVDSTDTIKALLSFLGLGSFIGECLTAPSSEPSYPPPGLRP